MQKKRYGILEVSTRQERLREVARFSKTTDYVDCPALTGQDIGGFWSRHDETIPP
jgi:hypothetical protein